MISQQEIWRVLQARLNSEAWTPLDEIYRIVENDCSIGDAPRLKWTRNVRNVLQRRKASGEVLWDGKGSYRIAP